MSATGDPRGFDVSDTTFLVDGMTCGHCVASVTAELAKVPGVSDVAVDLERGEVSVASSHSLEDSVIRAAVEEVGYEFRGRSRSDLPDR